MKKLAYSLFFSTLSTGAFAQQPATDIIIREVRLSDKSAFNKNASVQIISAADIQRMNAHSVADILHYALGVQAGNRGMDNAQTDIKINGGTFEQTMILINGHPVIDAQTGHHLMNLPIHINDIHHIEIIAGPRAHSYGINGLAGSINIVTKQENKNSVTASLFAGSSFGKDSSGRTTYANAGMHVGATHQSKYASHYLSLSALKSSGFMYNTGVNNAKIFYSNAVQLPHDHLLNLQVAYVSNAFGANGFYAYPYDKNSTEKVNTLWATLDHQKNLNENWKIKSNIALRRNTDDYIFIKSNPSYYHNVHKSWSTNLNINAIYNHKMGEFALGLNSNYQQINSTNLGENERYNNGFFAENSLHYKKLNASAGLYGNYNSAWGFSVLPGLDIGYAPTDHIRVYASAGSANRIPTYTDLYYKGPSNIGNSELQPERSYGLDAGIKYESAKCQVSASVFHRKVSNLIDWTKDKNASIWQPSNFGLQTIQGAQLMTRLLFNTQEPVFLKELSAKYQFINSGIVNTLQQTDSKYALDYFRHQTIGAATVSVYNYVMLTISARYQYRFNYHDYTLMDARVGYTGKRMNLYADVNNILNTVYHESNAQPMPSRWFNAGANFRFTY